MAEGKGGGALCLAWTAHFQRVKATPVPSLKALQRLAAALFLDWSQKPPAEPGPSSPLCTSMPCILPATSGVFLHSCIISQWSLHLSLLLCDSPFRSHPNPASSNEVCWVSAHLAARPPLVPTGSCSWPVTLGFITHCPGPQ